MNEFGLWLGYHDHNYLQHGYSAANCKNGFNLIMVHNFDSPLIARRWVGPQTNDGWRFYINVYGRAYRDPVHHENIPI